MARTSRRTTEPTPQSTAPATSYRYDEKRKNIPPAGLAAQGKVEERPSVRYRYDPHLPPELRFDATGRADGLPALLAEAQRRALTADEVKLLQDALRTHQPWLEWTGKAEKGWFDVDPVALHIHERVSAEAILKVAARQPLQRGLFADPELEYREAVKFYQHEIDWANRLILGDSLVVMNSLAKREDLAGKVQMIYMDPPYGIKFASNFQPFIDNREVKDRSTDLTREPEQVKAYRDTWTLGIHSYLTYLRERLVIARELLADTGSVFVQISDENLHRIRSLMDEVFGVENFLGLIAFVTTGGQSTERLGNVFDFLIWYGRDAEQTKYYQLFDDKELREGGGWAHSRVEFSDGVRENVGVEKVRRLIADGVPVRPYSQDGMTSQGGTSEGSNPYSFQGRTFGIPPNSHWKTTAQGRDRLAKANRIEASANSLRYVRFIDDFPVQPITNIWDDTNRPGYIDVKRYVVQTTTKVIERCLLMTTDPGDLVLDPTAGSGTTAYVAEQWGRRWITIDTSRVAVALARQRLLTAKFEYYQPEKSGLPLDPETNRFVYKTVPHITLKSIAQNQGLDPIFARWEPALADKLAELNAALGDVTPELRTRLQQKLAAKEKTEGKSSITEADRRRWLLPQVAIKMGGGGETLQKILQKRLGAGRSGKSPLTRIQTGRLPSRLH